jgi:hypothetical protein
MLAELALLIFGKVYNNIAYVYDVSRSACVLAELYDDIA